MMKRLLVAGVLIPLFAGTARAQFIHTMSGTAPTTTCTNTSGTNYSTDVFIETVTANTAPVLPAASVSCVDRDHVELRMTQATGGSFTVTTAAGSGTALANPSRTGITLQLPTGTGSVLHQIWIYNATLATPTWELVTQETIPTSSTGNAGVTNGAIKTNGSGIISQAACADLSNGATGCSTATGTSGATLPLNNGANAFSGPSTGVTQALGDSTTTLATDAFVTNATASLTPALSALYATTGVLPNTPAYLNGASGVGATLISTSFGALTVDGVTAAVGDVVLVKNQASSFQNGLYTVTATGSGAAFYTLTRALNYDTASDMLIGTIIAAATGTTNGGTTWRQTTKVTTVGTDAVTFAQFTYALANTLNTLTAPDAGTRTATANRYLKGDGTNWNTSSGSASGTGACSANQFASTLNSDAAPTCTVPAAFGVITQGGAITNTSLLAGVTLIPVTATIQSGTMTCSVLTGCAAGGATVKVFDCGTSLPSSAATCTGGTLLETFATGTTANASVAATINSSTVTAAHYVGEVMTVTNSCTTVTCSSATVIQ